nr:protein-glutamine gamma-glutamyltransferase [uncultured Bacillus sp.]
MIQLSGVPFQHYDMWPEGSLEKKIVKEMVEDSSIYNIASIDELRFELQLRKNIISSAKEMNNSNMAFEIFATSRCNPAYWNLTETGGFRLRNDVLPSDAIQDIYNNSSLYGFECATAIIIIFYHAVLKTIGKALFNQYFQNLYLYSWHFDPDLGVQSIRTSQFLPGDVVYFSNPDVNPSTPWWRGENTVLLEDGNFFGHGIGIMTSNEIIQHLNKMRKPDSTTSAFLLNSAARPSFHHLYQLSARTHRYLSIHSDLHAFVAKKIPHLTIHHNKNSISFERYLRYLHETYGLIDGWNSHSL